MRTRKTVSLLLALIMAFGMIVSSPPVPAGQSGATFGIAAAVTVAEAAYGVPAITGVAIQGQNSVKVSWTYSTAADAVQSFKILDYKNNASGNELTTVSYRSGQTSYSQVLALDNGQYSLAVATVIPANDRLTVSSRKDITVDELAAPSDFKGTRQGTREILWTWTDNSYGETGFKIYDDDDNLIGRVSANQTYYRESGLKPDTQYIRHVRAYKSANGVDAARESSRSDTGSERTEVWSSGSASSTTRAKDRSVISDTIGEALKNSVSSSDIHLISAGDVDVSDLHIQTEKNRYVAFAGGSLKNYGDGSVRISTSDLELKIPAQYIHRTDEYEGTAIGLREYIDNTSAPLGKSRIGTAYILDLVRYSLYSSNGYTNNNFSSDNPAYITFYYDYWRVSNPASLKIYYINGSYWQELPSTVNTVNRAVHAKITEFGRYALFESPAGAPGVYPGSTQVPGAGNSGLTAGYPPGFGPGYGAGFSSGSASYNPAQYGSGYTGYPAYGATGATGAYGAGPAFNPTYGYYGGGTQSPFVDTIGHWAKPQIEVLAGQGLINGTAQRFFEPDKTMSRAEFLALLMRASGNAVSPPGAPPFQDVRADDWFAGALRQAMQSGVITEGGGVFRPYESISRQDMAAWIGRATRGRLGFGGGADPGSLSDWNEVAPELREDAAIAVRAGLLRGKPGGMFDPYGATTRAEAATVIYNLLSTVR
ncbi:hypothetical protein GTO91_07420 [Heliobacterium undosum]|uniref:SLH domain-containing protein n=1 Tax=Heliomicrobium undosum TaxID=121734 RepID=A0A845L3D7_9FIRM|nr:S-layer homology domain-containing protein [Heliomicrobium undosum]MZP29535.1 hypothetical protein [Heliomicrobium undosum]